MPEHKVLIIDACIPIAKFKGNEPPLQQQHTDRFCDLLRREPIKAVIIEKVLEEIEKKFPNLVKPIKEYLSELKAAGKFELIENKRFIGETENILELQESAKSGNFDLSFEDALQVYFAEKTKIPIISWDAGIIDFCETRKITAFRPNEFCDYYESKYC